LNSEEIEFDISGLDAPLANALRRTMIAEVRFDLSKYSQLPTMAIH